MLNKKLLQDTIDLMENEEEWEKKGLFFNMLEWRSDLERLHSSVLSRLKWGNASSEGAPVPSCGTVCCIGGTMEIALGLSEAEGGGTVIGNLLGLSDSEADALFFPDASQHMSRPKGMMIHTMQSTKGDAIRFLKALIAGTAIYDVDRVLWMFPEKETVQDWPENSPLEETTEGEA